MDLLRIPGQHRSNNNHREEDDDSRRAPDELGTSLVPSRTARLPRTSRMIE